MAHKTLNTKTYHLIYKGLCFRKGDLSFMWHIKRFYVTHISSYLLGFMFQEGIFKFYVTHKTLNTQTYHLIYKGLCFRKGYLSFMWHIKHYDISTYLQGFMFQEGTFKFYVSHKTLRHIILFTRFQIYRWNPDKPGDKPKMQVKSLAFFLCV